MLMSDIGQHLQHLQQRIARFRVAPRMRVACACILVTTCSLHPSLLSAQSSPTQSGTIYSFSNPSTGQLDLSFTQQIQDALVSGVPLSIELDFVYITPRLLLDNHSMFERHEYTIRRHALSNRYMVLHNQEVRPQLFTTLVGLTDHLSTDSVRLFAEYIKEHQPVITSDASVAHLRLALDKYKLPGPVRLSAFVSNQWEFDTGWVTWDLEN